MGALKFSINSQGMSEIKALLSQACSKAEHALAVQVEKDTQQYVPASGNAAGLTNRTRVIGNTIVYPGPYARYLYYGKVMVNRQTLKGPMHFIDKSGNEMIKFPAGSKLIPTDRDLHFNTHFHRKAQAHWFEASKAQNLKKWTRDVKKEIEDGIKK